MVDPELLQILVDTDVQVASDGTPRRIVESIRRHLRQHALGSTGNGEEPLSLLLTQNGQHRLPQGLLPKLTETCRRHGVPYAVTDRRAMVSCPAFRSHLNLEPAQQEVLRQLLLRDTGVLVATSARTRLALALALITRRQQRTLVLVESRQELDSWLAALRQELSLEPGLVGSLTAATPESQIVVGRYDAILRLPPTILRREFGMVLLDGLSSIDALTLMKVVRGVGARFLLGLAADPQRPDGLQGTIFLALGGLIAQLKSPPDTGPIRLGCHFRSTPFSYPYQGRQQYQALIARLAADPDRAQLIAEEIAAEASAGHPCLVLSERRDHLEHLSRLLPEDLPRETLTSAVHLAERRRIVARFEEGQLVVLLATGQLAREAVCTPRASRLFLTFPFSYTKKLEPTVRWLIQPTTGKEEAKVFDYDDPLVPPLHRAFTKRREVLSRLSRETERQTQLELVLE